MPRHLNTMTYPQNKSFWGGCYVPKGHIPPLHQVLSNQRPLDRTHLPYGTITSTPKWSGVERVQTPGSNHNQALREASRCPCNTLVGTMAPANEACPNTYNVSTPKMQNLSTRRSLPRGNLLLLDQFLKMWLFANTRTNIPSHPIHPT